MFSRRCIGMRIKALHLPLPDLLFSNLFSKRAERIGTWASVVSH
jgi:hypothetical protein